jgi:hypothetical protein
VLDELARHLLGHRRRRRRHRCEGRAAVTGEGPDAEGGGGGEHGGARAGTRRGLGRRSGGEAREREGADEGRSRPAGASPPFIDYSITPSINQNRARSFVFYLWSNKGRKIEPVPELNKPKGPSTKKPSSSTSGPLQTPRERGETFPRNPSLATAPRLLPAPAR